MGIRITAEVITIATGIVCIYSGSLRHLKDWKKLWINMNNLDVYLFNVYETRSKWIYRIQITATAIFIGLNWLYFAYDTVSENKSILIDILYPTIEFLKFIWLLIFYNFISCLQARFQTFHKLMERDSLNTLGLIDCKSIETIYLHLVESFRIVNRIFGIPIFMITTSTMVLFLFVISIVLQGLKGNIFSILFAMLNLIASANIQLSVVIIACAAATMEMNKSSYVICKLMVKLQSKGVHMDVIKELYPVLNASRTNFRFTAAGFFVVGNSLIF
ncbi:PREDICTED: uncharacterized protein LOC108558359, partial [Nicrophorus vespilloides]|uniref:Uncharacterized protein LOC108558359 n=1 Tax=Nicrophorus vespilloides TaxID=110193 RepID=A0ABM1M846_NICVS